MAMFDDFLSNCRDLDRRLAQSEDHFREALPQLAVMVDPGESQVLDRRRLKQLCDLAEGLFGRHRSSADLVQQLLHIRQSNGRRNGSCIIGGRFAAG